MTTSTNDNGVPYTVAIVAMGPSRSDYIAECISKSSRFQVADETWAINAMGSIIQHDRLFVMDDLPYFHKVSKETNKALVGYNVWLHKHPGPIYAQKAYKDFPGAVEYPLEAVLNVIQYPYINNTTAYALCYAIYLGVKHIKLYGMDFTYANNRGFAEAGRACIEHWIRDACWRGIKVTIAPSSTLMDTHNRQFYGYSKQPTVTKVEGKYRVTYN
jgi:hypothetical protein